MICLIRYIKSHADEYHIDISKIIASGGSSGGHLAAATALVKGFNEETDDLTISCIPNALILYNPVYDVSPAGYEYKKLKGQHIAFSPLHNITYGAPPTIVFLGTEDEVIPVETAQYYKVAMERAGSRCDLVLYEGQEHTFFNYPSREYYKKTVFAADTFLISLGYLQGKPLMKWL